MIKTPKVEIVHLDSEGKAYQGEEETPHKIWVATLRGGGGEHVSKILSITTQNVTHG